MNSNPIIVEQVYNSSVSRVWKAITDKNQMQQWFFSEMDSFKPEVGFKTQFNVRNGDKDYLHIWEITEIIPNKKITTSWKYKGYTGEGFVTFELIPDKNNTKLRLTNLGLETFPQDNPDFSRESCIAGWNYFICQRLKEFLEK